uniref:MULE transposase domain-containing protein n=1 Tax=Heliothis virescens TaxID=7102 RepID=A0A2A4J8U0_HELVI
MNQKYPKVEFFQGRKGAKILWRAGFRYTLEKINKKDSSIWRCHNRKCKGSLTWNTADETVVRVSDHQCKPNFDYYKIEKIRSKLKKAVCDSYDPIPKVYDDFMKKYKTKNEYDAILPSFLSIKDTLYKARKDHLAVHATTFKLLKDVVVPKILAEDFLLVEDGADNKILVFCSLQARETVKSVSHFFGDGTFKSAPYPFKQIYTLHGDTGSTSNQTRIAPLIFSLLPNKEEVTYLRLFELIKKYLPGMTPTYYQTDYELPAMNAFKIVFPDVTIRGCLFHYSQAINRKAKKLGIPQSMRTSVLAKLKCLAYLPVRYMSEGFMSITIDDVDQNYVREWDNFISYYIKQWMKPNTLNIVSCYDNRHRTINAAEGWHFRLNSFVGRKKPSLYQLINILKDESVHYDFLVRRSQMYVPYSKKRQQRDIITDQRISKIVDDLIADIIDVKECIQRLSKIKFL